MMKAFFDTQIVLKFSDTKSFFNKIKNNLVYFKQIKIIRNYFRMTQKQLSKRTGISRSIISKIESGDSNISIKQLEKIADGLSCDLQVVLTPKKRLSKIKDEQVEKVARFLIKNSLGNIALEGHYLTKKQISIHFKSLKQELNSNPKNIWDY